MAGPEMLAAAGITTSAATVVVAVMEAVTVMEAVVAALEVVAAMQVVLEVAAALEVWVPAAGYYCQPSQHLPERATPTSAHLLATPRRWAELSSRRLDLPIVRR